MLCKKYAFDLSAGAYYLVIADSLLFFENEGANTNSTIIIEIKVENS